MHKLCELLVARGKLMPVLLVLLALCMEALRRLEVHATRFRTSVASGQGVSRGEYSVRSRGGVHILLDSEIEAIDAGEDSDNDDGDGGDGYSCGLFTGKAMPSCKMRHVSNGQPHQCRCRCC